MRKILVLGLLAGLLLAACAGPQIEEGDGLLVRVYALED
jgi:hypothetical protein